MIRILKTFFAGIFILGAAFTLFVSTGQIPDTKAVTGAQLPASAQNKLIESGIVNKNETIKYYYSEGLTSFVEYGNLFTDARVISYELDQDTNERNIYTASYNDISDIQFFESEAALEDSLIDVYEDGERSFSLVVSTEEGGDKVFFNELTKTWKANLGTIQQAEAY